MHQRPTIHALLLFALAACSGSGSTAPASLALLAIDATTAPASRDTTLAITCVADEPDGIVLEFLGTDVALDCTLTGDDEATCTIPAGALQPGVYDLRLRRGATTSEVLEDALEITPDTRPIDGFANLALLRLVPSAYADGAAALGGADRPNVRAISNAVSAQAESVPNARGASDFLWQWGQFLDHDIDLTPEAEPEEAADILIPADDLLFVGAMAFHRSAYVVGSLPREQINVLTAVIDASNVYGSTTARATTLRALDGTGRLKTSAGNLLPFNVDGEALAGGTETVLFIAGDDRVNEQIALTVMHTLFMREHNRLADEIRARSPALTGDEVYEAARRIVGAQMQVITYREFLPLLLGDGALAPYRGHDAGVDPGIANIFSTAAYRLGHSMLSSTVLRLDAAGDEIEDGHLNLIDAFFHPELLSDEDSLDPFLRGLAAQAAQEIDTLVVDEVRNFLFGPPGSPGLDLVSLNLQRGRDHGLGSYNAARAAYGLERRTSFDEISSDPEVRARLAAVYGTVDQIDAWVGFLAEDHRPGAMVGETMFVILKDQFERLRDGDPFWHEATFFGNELAELRRTRLSDIVRRNTSIGGELPDDVFRTEDARTESRAPRALDDRRRRRLERRR